MDPKETLILLLLALAKNERAEAQDYADALADWLSKDGFAPTIDAAFLATVHGRLGLPLEQFAHGLLSHNHKYGIDHYLFKFVATESHPQPLIRPIAEVLLNADFEPDREETLELELLEGRDVLTLSGEQYADTTGQAFQGFDDDEILIGESDDDGEEESNEEEPTGD